MKKIYLLIIILIPIISNNLKAEVPYIVDFKYILNESEAGKKHKIF